MQQLTITGDALWDRVERAVENVRQRLERATAALEQAGVPYAVVGGHAVQVWVAQVDEAAVRTTRDVDLLLRRDDLPAASAALARAGFTPRQAGGLTLFLAHPEGKARCAVLIVFAGEPVRPDQAHPAPDVEPAVVARGLRTVSLEALVRLKLTSFRDQDRTHLRDLLEVGLVDSSWLLRLPPPLDARLQHLLDTPEG